MNQTRAHPSQPGQGKRSLGRRLLRWIVVVAIILLLADFILFPLGVAFFARQSARAAVGPPPEGFAAITLPATDGTHLAAWFASPQNGAAILVLPGAGGSREGLRSQVSMLADHGFGVLALDPRGAGESAGQSNRFGWAGTSDVGGAVAYLVAQPNVQTIGGWGFSMGGEVLLGAVGDTPQLAAVIADGATTRCYAEKFALESAGGPPVRFHAWLTDTFVALFTGDEPPTPMLESIQAAPEVRLLLIAAGDEPDELAYNALFADAAGNRAERWIVPGVGHTGGWDHDREAYTQRVLDFFAAALVPSS